MFTVECLKNEIDKKMTNIFLAPHNNLPSEFHFEKPAAKCALMHGPTSASQKPSTWRAISEFPPKCPLKKPISSE